MPNVTLATFSPRQWSRTSHYMFNYATGRQTPCLKYVDMLGKQRV